MIISVLLMLILRLMMMDDNDDAVNDDFSEMLCQNEVRMYMKEYGIHDRVFIQRELI